ncbi:hypothetical protein H072_3410 [Dactylellina haptotyla CBS 200.50]|uniref:F-box domain-containing protein n=1 Tax=Dactylellina haptotyla (strain CBS 200.50) TaxID=1284197 RepID=S8BSW6_DACHA|nr:hypothetical protein H072_3410 [Dactylellina haptotyla CBS 200.50]
MLPLILALPNEILSQILQYVIYHQHFKIQRAAPLALTCRRFYSLVRDELYSHCHIHLRELPQPAGSMEAEYYMKFHRFSENDGEAFRSAKKKLKLFKTYGEAVKKYAEIPGVTPRNRNRQYPYPNLNYLKSTAESPIDSIFDNLVSGFTNLTTANIQSLNPQLSWQVPAFTASLITKCLSLKRLHLIMQIWWWNPNPPTPEPTVTSTIPTAVLDFFHLDILVTPRFLTVSDLIPDVSSDVEPRETQRDIWPISFLTKVIPASAFPSLKPFIFRFRFQDSHARGRNYPLPWAPLPSKRPHRLSFPTLKSLEIHPDTRTLHALHSYFDIPVENITEITTISSPSIEKERIVHFILHFPNLTRINFRHLEDSSRISYIKRWEHFLRPLQPPRLPHLKTVKIYTKMRKERIIEALGDEFMKTCTIEYSKPRPVKRTMERVGARTDPITITFL